MKSNKVSTIKINLPQKNYDRKYRWIKIRTLLAKLNTKKEPFNKALNLNGGNDEARTRDLMRDRHAL